MSKTNKKVSMDVINILKSVMDYKVKPLRAAVDAGKRAAQEEPGILEYISSLQHFINNSRYDRTEALEAEQEMADYEIQASGIRAKINRGTMAAEQLVYADKFYESYKDTCRQIEIGPQLQKLEFERVQLERRLVSLENNMDACEINMTPSLYGADIANQSRTDYEQFSDEYDRIYAKLQHVLWQIKSLQK
ncbi:MAG: hypothetical protein IJE82_03730 [Alphaproteobacteria bacterium]|nr:hypothetical protein [Alphaproteobacteria bacterium]